MFFCFLKVALSDFHKLKFFNTRTLLIRSSITTICDGLILRVIGIFDEAGVSGKHASDFLQKDDLMMLRLVRPTLCFSEGSKLLSLLL